MDTRPQMPGIMPSRPDPPDKDEIERRFTRVLNCMDLPADKVKLLKSYDDQKKWELILDEEKVSAKQPPEYYLKQLRLLLEASNNKLPKKYQLSVKKSTTLKKKLSRSFRLKKSSTEQTSTQVLRDLEISLRTNSIHWVRDFLSDQHNGLDILTEYLSHVINIMKTDMLVQSTSEMSHSRSGSFLSSASNSRQSFFSSIRKNKSNVVRFGLADSIDDIHIGVQCLRAIMNHQHGFNLVFQHKQTINLIALSLLHNNYRTRTLVLELLAAVCLVSDGHDIIFRAFDNFKEVCGEKKRFETLMNRFTNYEQFHIDFMVACMQFVNIAVHSVEDMNYRVHLQHEFSRLGLDQHLERLQTCESERLQTQVGAYVDNRIDVAVLLEEADYKSTVEMRATDLEMQLSHLKEEMTRKQDEWNKRQARNDSEIVDLKIIHDKYKKEKEKEMTILQEALEKASKTSINAKESKSLDSQPSSVPAPPPPPPPPSAPPPPAPPAPPPPPMAPLPPSGGFVPPPPPPPPPSLNFKNVTIKKVLQPQQRLPVLNWIPMKPQQATSTVFADIDDEALYETMDWKAFEEMFKLGGGLMDEADGTPKTEKKNRKPEMVSLLEANRLRNVAITRRKIDLPNHEVVKCIQNLDLKGLPLERVEAVWRITPTEQECKALSEYQQNNPGLEKLSEEDAFLLALSKVPRLKQRLHIMSFIGNFKSSVQHLTPQISAVIEASTSIKDSTKLKQVLQVLLALGNYMNAGKRGPAYGFKLHSFDAILDLKTVDRKNSLMHFLAATFLDKFPHLCDFTKQLRCLDEAAAVCLENMRADVKEMERGMGVVRKELEGTIDKNSQVVQMLRDFIDKSEVTLNKIKKDAATADERFEQVLAYMGEGAGCSPASFFTIFSRLCKNFDQALAEVRSRANTKETDVKKQQQVVVSEMKRRYQAVAREKRVISREEVYHGALEDILLDLKNEPFRRADGVRRNNRNKINNEVEYALR